MADADENLPQDEGAALVRGRRRRALGTGVAVLALAAAIGWQYRDTVVNRLVSGQLVSLGLPGSYRIAEVGAGHQVLTDVVLGDPAHPDFTAERVETDVAFKGWAPGIQRVTLVKPRLYGRWRDGKLSFGSLDKLIYAKSTTPFRLPDMAVVVVDGRAGLVTPQGTVGLSLVGSGGLRDGFAGGLTVVMPGLHTGDCVVQGAGFHGDLRIAGERPSLKGPLRLERLVCGKAGLVWSRSQLDISAQAEPALEGGKLSAALNSGALTQGDATAQGVTGKVTAALHSGQVTAGYELAALAVNSGAAIARQLGLEGRLRGGSDLAKLTADGTLSGEGIAPGVGLNTRIAGWQKAAAGTLAAPLLAQMGEALRREGANSRLAGQYVAHRNGEGFSLVVPEAHLTGTNGQRLASLSRATVDTAPGQSLRLAGNLTTSGQGLPHLQARVETAVRGGLAVRLAMDDYRAGSARAAVPEMRLALGAGGWLGFVGRAVVSGALPGSETGNLVVPVDGRWSADGGLAIWQRCTAVGFDRLAFGQVSLEHRTISLCPVGPAILTMRGGATKLAARLPGLDVSGHMGTAPLHITGGAAQAGLSGAGNGQFSAKDLVVTLGGGAAGVEATRIALAAVDGRLGHASEGQFSGAEVALAGVPLDITKGIGQWRYGGGVLALSEAGLTLTDREKLARFQPLVARGADLRLEGGVITAKVVFREPKSDREAATATISHELDSGRGHADLALAGITFDDRLQPDTLSPLALGVIANASGVVKGQGRIDWQPGKVTSTGRFSTDGLDFAAAVGPLKGVAGSVEFTDLLGLVTAPDQHLRIGSINPGIEVADGELIYALLPGHVLAVKGAWWPFLDGRMQLMPTRMVLGASEVRRYEIRVEGMNAAKFLQRIDMSNLSATGTFDGSLPMVFDENGGRIEGGLLTSRPPGGSVSYVGELSYKDLSPMANYAFKALRALKYKEMRIGMDGAIAGELVTRVAMRGVSQGQGTKRNFITNQIGRLPIQFNVNLRAPFYQLITSFKSMYDPSYVRDPRSLGLIDANGRALPVVPAPKPSPQPAIQPPAREHLP